MVKTATRAAAWLLACTAVAAAAPALAGEDVRVLLFEETRRLTVASEGGIAIRLAGGTERTSTGPLVLQASGGAVEVKDRGLRAGSLTLHAEGGELTLTAVGGGKNGGAHPPPEGPVVVVGRVTVTARGGALAVVNEVDLEEYVKGVVPAEMNSAWHIEALKVQAIVARTYALYQRKSAAGRDYDVAASTQDQVYRGRRKRDERVELAVEATRGLVLTYGGEPIFSAFSSTAAGPTEDAVNVWSKEFPYLKGVDCPFDMSSPYYQWRAELRTADVETALRGQGFAVGTIAALTPMDYSRAGRVVRLRILHSGGELVLRGEELRKAVGYTVLPSTQFDARIAGQSVVFAGRGAGHAVGLCQWGAKEMAALGYGYETILGYFFPGTELALQRPTASPQRALR
jgi:stage II sporulation protein D